MVHSLESNEIKQVEFNTIASSFAGISSSLNQLHRYNQLSYNQPHTHTHMHSHTKLICCSCRIHNAFQSFTNLFLVFHFSFVPFYCLLVSHLNMKSLAEQLLIELVHWWIRIAYFLSLSLKLESRIAWITSHIKLMYYNFLSRIIPNDCWCNYSIYFLTANWVPPFYPSSIDLQISFLKTKQSN